jgi:hypothetical protein
VALFDLPAPILSFLDGLLQFLPPLVRLILWGLVSGVLSMLLYAALSPQGRLTAIKQELQEARSELARSDESFDELMVLVQRNLLLSFKHLGLVVLPALIASLPLISVLAWASNEFGYRFPADADEITFTVQPEELAGSLKSVNEGRITWPGTGESIAIQDGVGNTLIALPPAAPVPQIHKKLWWNTLIGNPMGYLPEETRVEAIFMDLPQQRHLDVGPNWLGHWLTIFFSALVAGALLTKYLFRIE